MTENMSSQKFCNQVKVFVYGTLKRKQPNHYWLTDSKNGFAQFIGEGRTVNKFPLVIGTRYNIPFLLNKCGLGNQINGEIYEVDEKMFSKLDILEDYPNYYNREIQDITINNSVVSCWLYLIDKFPESMLDKHFLSNYEDTDEQRYCERSKRDKNIKALNDLNF